MPYIKQKDRELLDKHLEELCSMSLSAGDITYCITKLVADFPMGKGLRYENLAMCNGIFMSAMLEVWRRVQVPYEEIKQQENGDVAELEQLAWELEYLQDSCGAKVGGAERIGSDDKAVTPASADGVEILPP